jgi:arsenate reductase
MKEVGIDLSTVRPRLLTSEVARRATLLVTMGRGDACSYVPGLLKLDLNPRMSASSTQFTRFR